MWSLKGAGACLFQDMDSNIMIDEGQISTLCHVFSVYHDLMTYTILKNYTNELMKYLLLQDLEGKIVVDKLEVISTSSKAQASQCISLAWSSDGQTLFAGYTDKLIRVWQVSMAAR